MYRYLRLVILLMLAGITSFVHSQPFCHLSVKDGLSDMVVNDIYKDSLGYMWFATSCSVERFDGHRFRHYPVPEENGQNREVNVLVGTSSNEIWFGTQTGLWSIGRDHQVRREAAGAISNPVYALLHRDSCLYVGTRRGLYTLRGNEVRHTLLGKDVLSESNVIKALAVDGERLWMATWQGLYAMRLSDGAVESYLPADSRMTTRYASACIYGEWLYLGLQEWGVVPFHLESRTFGQVIPIGPVTDFSVSPKDHLLYAATNGRGIYVLSPTDHHIVRQIAHQPEDGEGIRSNSIYSMLIDREGILWTGLFQIGVDYSLYHHELFSGYAPPALHLLQHSAIRCIAFNGTTKLFGTRDGLFFVNEEKGIYRNYRDELRAPLVMCACFFRGRYYIGTFGGGLYLLDPVTGNLSDFDDRITTFVRGQIFSITPDADGCLWIGTSDGLYCYQDGEQLQHLTVQNSKLPHQNVYRVFFDSSHRGWVCTDQGMALLADTRPHTLHTDFPKHFVHDQLIRDIFEDSGHRLYFCPDKGDLFVSDLALSHFHPIPLPGLQNRKLQFVTEDDEQWLWIGTDDGLFQFDKQQTLESYSVIDGLPTSNFLNCRPHASADGTLWFGTSQGVVFTDTRRIKRGRSYPYPIQITGVEYEDADTRFSLARLSGSLKLPSTQGRLTLYFSDFSYSDSQETSYQYRLKGKKADWQELDATSLLTLYNLRGSNRLELRRSGRPDSTVTFDIVAPRFTLWQWLWMATALLALIFILMLLRRRKKNTLQTVPPAATPPSEETSGQGDEDTSRQEDEETSGQEDGETSGQGPAAASPQKYKQVNLSDDDCRELARSLDRLMRQEKPYLNPKLKLTDLGQLLQVPTYKLSYLFNQYLDRPFYDYINEYRIREFKSLVAEGRNKSYTINTLTEQCGFTSRTTFFRYFKQFTGMTPNEYISQSEHPESSQKSVD